MSPAKAACDLEVASSVRDGRYVLWFESAPIQVAADDLDAAEDAFVSQVATVASMWRVGSLPSQNRQQLRHVVYLVGDRYWDRAALHEYLFGAD